MTRLIHLKTYPSVEEAIIDTMFEFSTRGFFGLDRYSNGQLDQKTYDMLEDGRVFCLILKGGRRIFMSGKRDSDDADEKAKLYAYNLLMDCREALERRGYGEERIFSETAEISEAIKRILNGNEIGIENLERYRHFFHIVGLPYHYRKLLISDIELPES